MIYPERTVLKRIKLKSYRDLKAAETKRGNPLALICDISKEKKKKKPRCSFVYRSSDFMKEHYVLTLNATNVACLSSLCSLYLIVPQSEGDMVKLVNVSRFDGCCNDLGVDSDFPCPCIPWVVSDTRVAARLQDVTDAVISHKHHWHTSWRETKCINTNFLFSAQTCVWIFAFRL